MDYGDGYGGVSEAGMAKVHDRQQSTSKSAQDQEWIALEPFQATFDKDLPERPSRRRNWESWRRRKGYIGWRYGVRVAAVTTFSALFVNTILLIWAYARFGAKQGIGTAYDGDCKVASDIATRVHILINIVGSLLLAASNYCMQCLAAPTREECDRAHAKYDWLDIGILSVRNIFKLNRWRIVLWLILAISSLPIHLVYNSTVFKTTTASDFDAYVVDENFVLGKPFTFSDEDPVFRSGKYDPTPMLDLQQDVFANITGWHELGAKECLTIYGQDYVQDYNDVLLITKDGLNNASTGNVYRSIHPIDTDYEQHDMTSWLCGMHGDCSVNELQNDPEQWSILDYHISSCIAQTAAPHCKVQFSVVMLVIVIVCNSLKLSVMIIIIFFHKSPTMVVLGDAIASYLRTPDATTTRITMLTRKDVVFKSGLLKNHKDILDENILATSWNPDQAVPLRRGAAGTRWQWTALIVICFLSLATTLGLLVWALSSLGPGKALNLGFGVVSAWTLVTSFAGSTMNDNRSDATNLVNAVLISNIPQLST